ncbi:MAG: PepSY domain-containing protein [Beijerinckiaceae bacterium]
MTSSDRAADEISMMRGLLSTLLFLLLTGVTTPVLAQQNCFSADETREHVEKHGLVSLHDVVRSVRGGSGSDLISARLCETNGNLVYMIAFLDRAGKVMRMTLDARSGNVINHR